MQRLPLPLFPLLLLGPLAAASPPGLQASHTKQHCGGMQLQIDMQTCSMIIAALL